MVLEALYKAISFFGSIASLIGIPLALIAIWQARNAARKSETEARLSKEASQIAKQAVDRFRYDIKLRSQIVDFEKALNLMDDIKSFIRGGLYNCVPERIASLIILLNNIRSPSLNINLDKSKNIQESVMELRKIEEMIDKLDAKEMEKKAAIINRRISNQIDQLHPIMISLRDMIGVDYDSE